MTCWGDNLRNFDCFLDQEPNKMKGHLPHIRVINFDKLALSCVDHKHIVPRTSDFISITNTDVYFIELKPMLGEFRKELLDKHYVFCKNVLLSILNNDGYLEGSFEKIQHTKKIKAMINIMKIKNDCLKDIVNNRDTGEINVVKQKIAESLVIYNNNLKNINLFVNKKIHFVLVNDNPADCINYCNIPKKLLPSKEEISRFEKKDNSQNNLFYDSIDRYYSGKFFVNRMEKKLITQSKNCII